MRKPRKTIADDKEERKEIPASDRDEKDEQNDPDRRTGKMQYTRERLGVLANVKVPEI